MKNPHLNIFAAIGVALPLLIAADSAAMAQDCLSGRDAQQAFQARRIMSFDRAAAAKGLSPKDIVSQTGPKLCNVEGRPYWQVNVQDRYGNSTTVDLPAEGD